jgi:hypothetical protein
MSAFVKEDLGVLIIGNVKSNIARRANVLHPDGTQSTAEYSHRHIPLRSRITHFSNLASIVAPGPLGGQNAAAKSDTSEGHARQLTQNAHVESFHRRLREECLRLNWFTDDGC